MKPAIAISLLLSFGCATLLAGCGQSKEDEALARARSRPKPGFVRILNLTSKDATLLSKGRPVNPDVPPGESGRLNPEGVGKRSLVVQSGGSEKEIEVELASDLGHTIILFPEHHVLLKEEPRKPVDGKNLNVVFMSADGTIASTGDKVKLNAASGTIELDPKQHPYEVASGTITVLGKEFKVEPKFAYTILLLKTGSGLKPYFMLNTANDVPAQTGTAAS